MRWLGSHECSFGDHQKNASASYTDVYNPPPDLRSANPSFLFQTEFSMTIHFGTDGWRAVISDTFTFTNLRMLSQAIGRCGGIRILG